MLVGDPDGAQSQFLRDLRQRAIETPKPEADAATTTQTARRRGDRAQAAERPKPAQPNAGQSRPARAALATERLPKDVLTRYVGRWKGDFWVYAPSGSLVERKTVQVDCAMLPDGRLAMTTHMFDLVGRKLVVVETSNYQVTGNDTVKVSIQRPTGKVETQNGRWNDNALFLTSVRGDGVEHFRERIADGKMLIDGYGIYGGSKDLSKHSVFVGRLKRE